MHTAKKVMTDIGIYMLNFNRPSSGHKRKHDHQVKH